MILSKFFYSSEQVSSHKRENFTVHLVQYSLWAKVAQGLFLFSTTWSFSVCKHLEVVLWSIIFDSQLLITSGKAYMSQSLEPSRCERMTYAYFASLIKHWNALSFSTVTKRWRKADWKCTPSNTSVSVCLLFFCQDFPNWFHQACASFPGAILVFLLIFFNYN